MLTRRTFGGFVSCALCAISAGFAATEVAAQGAGPPAAAGATPGVTRRVISQTDGPAPGYVTIIAEATIEPGVVVGRHTHPGIESGYVVEGSFELPIEGQKTLSLKPGDGFQVPPNTPHAGVKSDQKLKIVSTYVVEKGKPLASPA
jgi:quercetin dioxygenase-like cupin family protein